MEPKKIKRRTKQQRLPPTQPYYPWLLYFHDENQTFCNISDPTKTYSRKIPEFKWENIRTVQYGWFLLEKNKIENVSELSLWNPSNFEEINLPPLKHDVCIKYYIFSCSPTATDQVCSIVLFSYWGGPIADYPNIVFYCQLGDKQWTEVDYTKDLVNALAVDLEGHKLYENYIHRVSGMESEGVEGKLLEDYIHLVSPVYCNGRLYAESQFPRLLVVIEKLEAHGLKINSTHVIFPKHSVSFPLIAELLESNNELFYIQISLDEDKIISIDVHRLDFSQMVWERVKSIKDRVFFLSGVSLAFTCQVINPETEGGRIYLTFSPNNFLYIYNIEDSSLVMVQTFSNLPKWRDGAIWFMPDRRLTLSIQEERKKTQLIGGESSVAIHSNVISDRAMNSCAFAFESVHDYLHFRSTNSFFRLRAPVPFQRGSFSMSGFDLSRSPLFVFFEKENVLTFVHPKHGIKYKYSINLPEGIQDSCEICYSRDGWLLLAVNTFTNMFFNPFTKEVKQLAYGPAPEEKTRNTMCVGFSHPPTSSECVVIELQEYSRDMTIHTIFLGEEEWEGANFENCYFHLSNIRPCFHNGAFYYLSNKGKLGIVKVGEEDLFWEECEKPYTPCTKYYNCFLVECNGSLLSVFEGAFRNWVRVFKLNESKMTWTRVKSLGDHMLFVGDQSFSAVANIPGMENKIYFPRFQGDNIVFYSLETFKYHTFESSEVVDFHCVREKFKSSWIQQ